MQATAELQVIPLGEGISVRPQIKQVLEILKGYDFVLETHASGTDIEGNIDEILAAIKQCHETLHENGCIRLISYLKLETRTDKIPTLAGKRLE
ncbi:MAG: MTH1187 family thiamine-binding protein [Pseudomonadota bacterium]